MEAQESLEIIQSMIKKSKNSISNRSKYFLLWGWAVFITALAQYVLMYIQYEKAYYVWFSIPVVGIIAFIMGIKDRQKAKVTTYVNDYIRYIWQSLGIAFFITAFLTVKGQVNSITVYLLLYGIGVLATGRIIQYKPLIFGGILCFIFCIVSVIIPQDKNQILLFSIAVLCSYIIPGHLLSAENKKEEA